MTPLNMARHRNSPHMAFWRMIKQGHDHFELTHLEPKVDVCDKRYVIGALSTYSFSPADRCPAYEVPNKSPPRFATSSAATIFRRPS